MPLAPSLMGCVNIDLAYQLIEKRSPKASTSRKSRCGVSQEPEAMLPLMRNARQPMQPSSDKFTRTTVAFCIQKYVSPLQ